MKRVFLLLPAAPDFDDRGWVEYRLTSPASDRQSERRRLRQSFVVGVVADLDCEQTVVRGEGFTFVSDGLVEAAWSTDELFSFERTRIAEENGDITVVTARRNG